MDQEQLWHASNDHVRDLMELVEGQDWKPDQKRRWRLAMSAFARRVAAAADFEPAAQILDTVEEFIDRGFMTSDESKRVSEYNSEHSKRGWMVPLPWTQIDTARFFVDAAIGGAQAKAGEHFDAMYGQIVEYRLPDYELEWVAQAAIFKDIFGNPFRPAAFAEAWRSESAVALARTAYDTRNFSLLPILADALEEAGCDHPEVLGHCRGPGPHVRGCWVVDGVLGKQ
jgi:hypothetical protein